GTSRSDSGFSTAVVTGPGQDTGNIVFRWFPPGGISGRVVDQYGEPVESAIIQLVYSRVVAGRKTVNSWGFARTDDRGDYHFGPLPGGTYYLVVSGEPWQNRRNQSIDGAPTMAYAPVYSGNTTDLSRAAPIVLRPAEQARADFTLSAVPGS